MYLWLRTSDNHTWGALTGLYHTHAPQIAVATGQQRIIHTGGA